MKKKGNLREKHIFNVLLIIVVIIVLNIISKHIFFRLDLTSDKRYTLSQTTKDVVLKLSDEISIKLYLDGDLPVEFKRLQQSIIDLMEEYKVLNKESVCYEIINPYGIEDSKEKAELYNKLVELGLQPVNIQAKDAEGGVSQKPVFPGVLIRYNDVELAVNLLKNNPALPYNENLNNSIRTLEYELTSNIKALTDTTLEKVAFIEGHDELNQYEVGDITRELANYYQVDRGVINGTPGILDDYVAVVVARPQEKFNEADKFVLDQYLMNGGKILWLVEPVNIEMDSLLNGRTMAFIRDLNLDDQLFTYGVRINPDLIKDIQCNVIPVKPNVDGVQSQFVPAPWLYYPLAGPNPLNPITSNLNYIKTQFVSSIDTVGGNSDVKKSVLLSSSKSTDLVTAPVFISLQEVNENPDQNKYNKSFQSMAVLLEGEFPSVFRNRSYSNYLEGSFDGEFKEKSKPTKMIVISDGDIIRNEVAYRPSSPVIGKLGQDRFTRQTFGNKEFIVNAINYLTDETGLLNLRSREIKLRLIDKSKINTNSQKLVWQLVNTAAPIILVILVGLFYYFARKRKWGKTS